MKIINEIVRRTDDDDCSSRAKDKETNHFLCQTFCSIKDLQKRERDYDSYYLERKNGNKQHKEEKLDWKDYESKETNISRETTNQLTKIIQ